MTAIRIPLELDVSEDGLATFILRATPYTALQFNLEHHLVVRDLVDDLIGLAKKEIEERARHPSSTVRPG